MGKQQQGEKNYWTSLKFIAIPSRLAAIVLIIIVKGPTNQDVCPCKFPNNDIFRPL